MAQIEAGWSSRHEEKIEQLEKELGREVCGVPLEAGTPCSRWPVEGAKGRCSQHSKDNSFPEPIQFEKNEKDSDRRVKVVDPPKKSEPQNSTVAFFRRGKTIFLLAVVGFVIGASLTFAGLHLVAERETESDTAEISDEFEVNVDDPDFSRLQDYARQGNASQIVSFLQHIIDETGRPEVRAEALYRLFVFYESQAEIELALQAGDRFLSNFFGHPRTPEILYGAWFISENLAGESERAQRYRRRLLSDYPDSRWAEQLP